MPDSPATEWRLRLGVSLHCLTDQPTPKDILSLADSEIETLELPAQFFEQDTSGEIKGALSQLSASGRVTPMTIHAAFGGGKDMSATDETARNGAIEDAVKAVGWAAEARIPMVVVHASAEPISQEERPSHIAHCRESLRQIAARASDTGTKVAVELLPRTCLGNTVSELAELLDGQDRETLGVCLDSNHAMDRWRDLPDCIRELGDRLWTLHISDYDGVDEKHQMPGEGVVEWGRFASALRDIDYDGPFNYETVAPGETFSQRVENLEENFRWLRGLR